MRLVFFCVLCVSLIWPWQSKFKHICFSRFLPSAFERCSWESWPPRLPVQTGFSYLSRLCSLPFVSLSVGGCHFSFFSIMACGWEVNWITFMFFPMVWSILAKVLLAKHVSLSFKWLKQNECDSCFPSWQEHLSSYISFWKISIFPLPWFYTYCV